MSRLRPKPILALISHAVFFSSCNNGMDILQQKSFCGNGITEIGEECDIGDGNSNSEICTASCLNAYCGDGLVGPNELCDHGALNSDKRADSCRTNCVFASCGDGVIDSGESCDDGNLENGDLCNNNCQPSVCGNNILEPGEECDDGNAIDSDDCPTTCRHAFCGDGFILANSEEQCDDGVLNNDTEPNRCRENCTPPTCGDSVVDFGEQCDTGSFRSDAQPDACRLNCLLSRCNDGIVDTGEECDDANLSNHDSCLNTCNWATCGDGFTQTQGIESDLEECDLGAELNSDTLPDTCRANCVTPWCGDGVKDGNEECDYNNPEPTSNCTNQCLICTTSLLMAMDRQQSCSATDSPVDCFQDPYLFVDTSGNHLLATANQQPGGHGLPYTATDTYHAGNASAYFPFRGYIKVPASNKLQALMDFNSNDFTIEFYKRSGKAATGGYSQGIMGCSGSWDIEISAETANFAGHAWAYNQPLNAWEHFAFVRSGNFMSLYVNGFALPQNGTQDWAAPVYQLLHEQAFTPCDGDLTIGLNTSGNRSWNLGRMDDLRITKGLALYGGNFSPPQEALVACE